MDTLNHPDYDALIQTVMPIAEHAVRERGEFFPFAACVMANGDVQLLETEGDDVGTNVEEMLPAFATAFKDVAAPGDIRAIAVCFHPECTPPGQSAARNTIVVHLEHAEAPVGSAAFPYTREPEGLAFTDGFAQPAQPVYFTARRDVAGDTP